MLSYDVSLTIVFPRKPLNAEFAISVWAIVTLSRSSEIFMAARMPHEVFSGRKPLGATMFCSAPIRPFVVLVMLAEAVG
jgi:hypothetical protein